MRVRALLLDMRKRTEEAIGLVVEGLEIARSQGALSWELKLASTLVGIDDRDSARDMLCEILNRTTEGFGTRDYRNAVGRLRHRSQDDHIQAPALNPREYSP